MKHFNLKLVNVFTLSILSVSTFAQGSWLQGGNGLLPPPNSVAIPANQLLGTTVNFPLRFITNNTQRMYINNNAFLTPGYVGIGPNFSAPQQLLHLHIARDAYAQFTNNTTGSGAGNGLLVGISDGPVTSSGHARLIQQSDYPMDFFTNNVQRFQLYNGNAATGGKAVFSNNLPLNYFPQERVTIYNNSADSAMLHFANNTTGSGAGFC